MGLIDQMKYAKILYLADVLEDILNEMKRDCRGYSYDMSISDIVKGLRETVAVTSAPNGMEFNEIEIKRLEQKRMISAMEFLQNEQEAIEYYQRLRVEDELLHFIKENKLIRVQQHGDGRGNMVFTASLIVGIEKRPYVPQEQPYHVDESSVYDGPEGVWDNR